MLNGQGGTLDLRGLTERVFDADTQLKIYADEILADEGINLEDILGSIFTVSPGMTLSRVAISSEEQFIGDPGTKITVPVNIINLSNNTETYTLSVKDSAGWNIGTLPATVTLEKYKSEKLNLDVNLLSESGKTDLITITATSQSDPGVKGIANITVSVTGEDESENDTTPPADSDNDGVYDEDDAFPSDPNGDC